MAVIMRTCIDLDTGEVMSREVIGEINDQEAGQKMCRALTGKSARRVAEELYHGLREYSQTASAPEPGT